MEIIKLIYRNNIWAHKDAYVETEIIKDNKDYFQLSYYKSGNSKLNVFTNNEETKILKEMLKHLQVSILNEKNNLCSFVDKDEKWKLIIEFSDGSRKEIEGLKEYCDFWKILMVLYFWVKEHCENSTISENSVVNDMTDIDIWEIDTKFELLDQATISRMTGTGSNLK